MTQSGSTASDPSHPDPRTQADEDGFSMNKNTFSFLRDQSQESGTWADDRILLTPPRRRQTSVVDPLDPAIDNINAQAFQANQQASYQAPQLSGSSEHALQTQRDAAHLLSGLQIKTDSNALRRPSSAYSMDSDSRLRSSASTSSLQRQVPSIRAQLHSSAGSVSPGTSISSPQITAMLDITPLPSPVTGSFESWKVLSKTRSRGSSISSLRSLRTDMPPPPVPSTNLSPTSPRRKGYPGLQSPPAVSKTSEVPASGQDGHPRSVSDYVPDSLAVPKPRPVAVSSTGTPFANGKSAATMHREEFLGHQRGLHPPNARLPTPPQATEEPEHSHEDEPTPKRPKLEIFKARSIVTGEPRSYEAIRQLGQGTFSTVYLAVRLIHKDRQDSVDYRRDSVTMAGVKARSRRLVAVKVVEHGPAGGADAQRIEMGLQREVDILKSILHPSLVHLKAFGNDGDLRALLVMNYCPGGDLFDVASKHREMLVPALVRRIFAELVSAARYLHQKFIVHRDIKLESRYSMFQDGCWLLTISRRLA